MAKTFDGFNRLLEKVRESSHDFVVTTEIFPNLDVERVARDMNLVEEGKSRGDLNQPPKSSKSLDDVELAIVGKVQDAKSTAYNNLEDQLQLFAGRLGGLDFEGQFSDIHKANAEGVSDFKAEIVRGRNELHGLRRALNAAEEDYADFRRRHRITRAPRLSEGYVWFLKVSFLIFLFLVESIMNGVFLAKGSDMGIVGGIVEALSFSFLNIGIALVFALFCVSLVAQVFRQCVQARSHQTDQGWRKRAYRQGRRGIDPEGSGRTDGADPQYRRRLRRWNRPIPRAGQAASGDGRKWLEAGEERAAAAAGLAPSSAGFASWQPRPRWLAG